MTPALNADLYDAFKCTSTAGDYWQHEASAYDLSTVGSNPFGYRDLSNGRYDIY